MFANDILNYIVSFALSFTLVFIATGKFDKLAVFVSILLGFLIYLLVSSATGQNLMGSLPPATYPVPPH